MPTLEARLAWEPRRALDLLRETRRLRKAAQSMPKPVPWDWVSPRLLPLLAGPYLGPDRLVTSIAPMGCAVVFGIEVKGTYILVDDQLLERWERSVDQLAAVASANLERRAAALSPAKVRQGILSGRVVRLLEDVPWASSLLLASSHLVRLFGPGDQILAPPRRDLLLSLPIETPGPVAAHIVTDFEVNTAFPLLLDPFALIEGELVWEGQMEEEESPDDW